MDLSALDPGQTATVVHVDSSDQSRLHKLLAMGIVPGCTIELRHRYPAFVFRLGNTQYAVDARMASAIVVQP